MSATTFFIILFVCASGGALLCRPRRPNLVLPHECASDDRALQAPDGQSLVLLLNREWPESTTTSVTAFIATLKCAFNGSFPDFASPIAFTHAPRFTLGSAVVTDELPSRDIVLTTVAGTVVLALHSRRLPRGSRVGIVPLLYFDDHLPPSAIWQQLSPTCTTFRSRHRRALHSTLCAVAVGDAVSAALAKSMAAVDCDWFLMFYGRSPPLLPAPLPRFSFHVPFGLKTDLLLIVASVAHEYQTVMFMDEDILFAHTSAQWEAELVCAFGHLPIVWRPTFRPRSESIWPWMNADCFDSDVRALSLGNFTFIEPQILFMRSDFFVFYASHYIAPLFAANPALHSIWSLVSNVCFLAKQSFPDAVACALSLRITAEHADLRTIQKHGRFWSDAYELLQRSIFFMPETQFELDTLQLVRNGRPCAPTTRRALSGAFVPWQVPYRTQEQAKELIKVRIAARANLTTTLCGQAKAFS